MKRKTSLLNVWYHIFTWYLYTSTAVLVEPVYICDTLLLLSLVTVWPPNPPPVFSVQCSASTFAPSPPHLTESDHFSSLLSRTTAGGGVLALLSEFRYTVHRDLWPTTVDHTDWYSSQPVVSGMYRHLQLIPTAVCYNHSTYQVYRYM